MKSKDDDLNIIYILLAIILCLLLRDCSGDRSSLPKTEGRWTCIHD